MGYAIDTLYLNPLYHLYRLKLKKYRFLRPETKSTRLPLGTASAQPSMSSADRRVLLRPTRLGGSIMHERGDQSI